MHTVLHVIGVLGIGGAERQLVQTLRHMDRERFQNIVLYFHPPDDLRDEVESLGVPVIRLADSGRIGWVKIVRSIRKAIKEHRADLVHGSVFPADVFALVAGATARVPVVVTVTNTFDARERSQAGRDAGDALFKSRMVHGAGYAIGAIAARAASSRFVAISEAVRRSAIKDLHLPQDRISVVYRGLTPESYVLTQDAAVDVSVTKARLGLTGAYPILLNTARWVPQKGQADLLRAMPTVLAEYPNARLLMAGEGPLRATLEQLRDDLGLRDSVQLFQKPSVPLLLRLCDIFVFSSHYEGLGNAVIEASAAGKPVVAFHLPALSEIVEDGLSGVLVTPRDPVAFARAVLSVAGQRKTVRAMGERGSAIVREKFDIRTNTRKLEALYGQLLQARSDDQPAAGTVGHQTRGK